MSPQTCVALLHGQVPQGADLATIRPACEDMIRRGASAGASARASSSAGSAGSSALGAFEQAGSELVGRGTDAPLGYGRTSGGDRRNLVTSNPIGWFSGLGVNATLSRSLESFSRVSWLASARFSRTNVSNGNATTFGLGTGLDLFVFGGNNEGLRIGPRLDLSIGDETFGGTTTYARVGLSGELGYNFIARNGISALGAVGFGGRIAGDSQNESFTSFTGGEVGPYLKLGIGYAF